mgnify:CR=1 FL=1
MSGTAGTSPYRIPAALRDLVMLDLLEITGNTTATADVLAMSQPSVSRRYRALARDLGLERQSAAPVGRRFADAPWITLLRRGVNHHRLARGVLRIGIDPHQDDAFAGVPWAECIHLGKQQRTHWRALLALELVDAIAITDADGHADEEANVPFRVQQADRSGRVLTLICRRDPLVLETCQRITAAQARP